MLVVVVVVVVEAVAAAAAVVEEGMILEQTVLEDCQAYTVACSEEHNRKIPVADYAESAAVVVVVVVVVVEQHGEHWAMENLSTPLQVHWKRDRQRVGRSLDSPAERKQEGNLHL